MAQSAQQHLIRDLCVGEIFRMGFSSQLVLQALRQVVDEDEGGFAFSWPFC
jgi:hypothetical protein